MSPKALKWLRVVVAAAVLTALTAAMVDFRGLVPWPIGRTLAQIQFVPSLVALLSGAGLSFAAIVIAAITFAVGRIYCSAICPLGIFQDLVIRLASWWKRKQRLAPYARPLTWVRQAFLWGTLAAAVAGFGGFALSLLDPYSNFARIASDLFRPLLILANNAVASYAEKLGWKGLFHLQPHWAALGALTLPLLLLLLVIVLAAWRGRLYCNTMCPVGTVLGWFARRAAFRLEIDRSACRKCAACLRVCKAQCIDLRTGVIDFSRCVACYNCLGACEEQAIHYRFDSPRKPRMAVPPAVPTTEAAAGPRRRAFLRQVMGGVLGTVGIGGALAAGEARPGARGEGQGTGSVEKSSRVICPPGSSAVEAFLDRCTACHLCISECPTAVLQPAIFDYGWGGFLKPHMDYSVAFCNFDCRRCGEVCPDGAILRLDLEAKHLTKIGEAQFAREKCVVVTNGTDCAACSEHCPTKAVSTSPYTNQGKTLRLPSVNKELCIGCGACEYACPAKPDKAIKVAALRRHGWARKNFERKATLPKPSGDFPF